MKNTFYFRLLGGITALLLLSLVACQQTISLEIDDFNEKIVVISKCHTDSVPVILLSISESAYGYLSEQAVNDYTYIATWIKGAKVTLTDETTGQAQVLTEEAFKTDTAIIWTYDQVTYLMQKDTIIQPVMAYRGNIPLQAGHSYALLVEHNQKSYRATATAPSENIENLSVREEITDDSTSSVYVSKNLVASWTDTANTSARYAITTTYRKLTITRSYGTDTLPDGSITYIMTYDSTWTNATNTARTTIKANDQGIAAFPVLSYYTSDTTDVYDTKVSLRVSRISQTEADFYEALYRQYNNGNFNDPFQEPTLMASYIENGLGFFSISGSKSTTTHVNMSFAE